MASPVAQISLHYIYRATDFFSQLNTYLSLRHPPPAMFPTSSTDIWVYNRAALQLCDPFTSILEERVRAFPVGTLGEGEWGQLAGQFDTVLLRDGWSSDESPKFASIHGVSHTLIYAPRPYRFQKVFVWHKFAASSDFLRSFLRPNLLYMLNSSHHPDEKIQLQTLECIECVEKWSGIDAAHRWCRYHSCIDRSICCLCLDLEPVAGIGLQQTCWRNVMYST